MDNQPSDDKGTEKKTEARALGNYDVYFSRAGFIFIIFTVLSSGYISELLSCQMRFFFETNPIFRHFVGILMFFIFIMLEGGWSFNTKEDDMFANNWASGNVIHTFIMASVLYTIFFINSKSSIYFNLIFIGLIFFVYCINTQRSYMYIRHTISDETNKNLLNIEYGSVVVALITLVSGFFSYIDYQQKQHKRNYSIKDFILGGHECRSIQSLKSVSS